MILAGGDYICIQKIMMHQCGTRENLYNHLHLLLDKSDNAFAEKYMKNMKNMSLLLGLLYWLFQRQFKNRLKSAVVHTFNTALILCAWCKVLSLLSFSTGDGSSTGKVEETVEKESHCQGGQWVQKPNSLGIDTISLPCCSIWVAMKPWNLPPEERIDCGMRGVLDNAESFAGCNNSQIESRERSLNVFHRPL